MMKIALPKNFKDYTVNQIEQMMAVINAEKEDDETVQGWARYAINEAIKDDIDCIETIYKATAVTALNGRIWDAYGEGTGMADVWIEAVAETANGFIKIGAYLSDIWQSGAIDYRQHEYVEKFKRV